MESFGVSFRIDRQDLYASLLQMFAALKEAKSSEDFGEIETWHSAFAEEVRSAFDWPTALDLASGTSTRDSRPLAIIQPAHASGLRWDFGSFIDAIENGEYSLLDIVKTSDSTAELRIDPEAYPYGGIGPFVALIEAHGMCVLGVNEYGKYQPLQASVAESANKRDASPPSWWKFWQRR